jgi:hypothetical protein
MKGGTMKRCLPLWAVVVAAMPGCYSFVPVGVEAVSPGENVRARITAEASGKLPEAVPSDNRLVEGELLERRDDGFTLFVPTTVRQQGFYSESLHERVWLSSADVIDLERRELDRPRTYVLAGVGAAAVVAIALKTLTGKTGGNTIDRTDQGPSANLIPLFTIRTR